MPLYGFPLRRMRQGFQNCLLRFSDVPVCPACGSEKNGALGVTRGAGAQIRRDQEIMAG